MDMGCRRGGGVEEHIEMGVLEGREERMEMGGLGDICVQLS